MSVELKYKHQRKTYGLMKDSLKKYKRSAHIYPMGGGNSFPEPACDHRGGSHDRGSGAGNSHAVHHEPSDGGGHEGFACVQGYEQAGERVRFAPGPRPVGCRLRRQGRCHSGLREHVQHPHRSHLRLRIHRYHGPQLRDLVRLLGIRRIPCVRHLYQDQSRRSPDTACRHLRHPEMRDSQCHQSLQGQRYR